MKSSLTDLKQWFDGCVATAVVATTAVFAPQMAVGQNATGETPDGINSSGTLLAANAGGVANPLASGVGNRGNNNGGNRNGIAVKANADGQSASSLMRVPDSAAFYFATLNHQAMVEAIFESNAWKSIKSSDVARGMKKAYRRGKTRGYEDYNEDNPLSQYLEGYGETIGSVAFQSVWQVAREAVKNEFFVYVDNDYLPLSKASNRFYWECYQLLGDYGFDALDEDNRELMQLLFDSLVKNFKDVQCPTMLIGARLDDGDNFRGLLDFAELGIEQGLNNVPEEAGFIKRWWKVDKTDDHYLLAFDIDLNDLPWEELLSDFDDEELGKKIVDFASTKRASVAMGIIDDLLVIGVAENREKLTAFGSGGHLIDLPRVKRLKKAIDDQQTVTGVYYISPESAAQSGSLVEAFNSVKPLFPPAFNFIETELEEELDTVEFDGDAWAKSAIKEVGQFVEELQQFIPQVGMQYGFMTLQNDGFHGYTFADVKTDLVDGSKPLELANHANQNTMLFFVQRPAKLAEQYGFAKKWTARVYDVVKQNGMPILMKELEAESKTNGNDFSGLTFEQFTVVIKKGIGKFEAFAQSVDAAITKRYIPSVAGTEGGLFVDFVSGPKSWHPEMPPAEQPLPIPLPAIVIGTNDSAETVGAIKDIWAAINKAVDDLNEIKNSIPGESHKPDASLINPKEIKDGNTVAYRWDLISKFAGFDSSIQTGMRASENWVVFNFHPGQAKSLIQSHSDNGLFGPAAADSPSTAILYYDHRATMSALRKWMAYAEAQARASGELKDGDLGLERFEAKRKTLQFSEDQMRDALERVITMVECWKGVSMRAYEEGDGVASQWHIRIEDIPAEK